MKENEPETEQRRVFAERATKVLRTTSDLLDTLIEKGYHIPHREEVNIIEAAFRDGSPGKVVPYCGVGLTHAKDFTGILGFAKRSGLECCGVQDALRHIQALPYNATHAPTFIAPLSFDGLYIRPAYRALIAYHAPDDDTLHRHLVVRYVDCRQAINNDALYLFATR